MEAHGSFSLGKGLSIYKPKATTVSARNFVRIVQSSKVKVKTTRYIPPKLGSKSLGKFYVEFK